MRQLKIKITTACMALIGAVPTASIATENGLLTYPLGVSTVLDGILPAPGATQFYSYAEYYTSTKFAGPDGKCLLPGFKTSVFVEAPRIIHTWAQTLGPFTLSSGGVFPLVHASVAIPGLPSDSRTSIGDVILQPLFFGYASPTQTFFAYAAPLDMGVPTGAYSSSRTANTGTNTYAYMPNVDMTWFPTRQWEISATALYEANSANHATKYHSGNVATFEYVAGYMVTEKIQLGFQGYALRQTTDDTVNGSPVGADGFRGKAYAVGPQFRYDLGPTAGLILKFQHEFGVDNRPQGNKTWIEACFPL